MGKSSPAITGRQLIRLLEKGGWKKGRRANHGIVLTKYIGGQTRVTFVPDTSKSLPDGTLSAILGLKQTSIGKKGLSDLIERYGLN